MTPLTFPGNNYSRPMTTRRSIGKASSLNHPPITMIATTTASTVVEREPTSLPVTIPGPHPTRSPSPNRRILPFALALGGFIAIAAAVWFVVFWSVQHPPAVAPIQAPVPGAADLPAIFRGWAHWDASWYTSISRDGYHYQPGTQSSVAYFPLFPLLIRLVVAVSPGGANAYIVGTILTLIAGITAAALFWVWCRERFSAPSATMAVLLLAVYPYSIYLYGPVYADALFLAGVLGAFVLLERDHILAAAIVGAFTTAARSAGLILAIALVARLIEIRARERSIAIDDPVRQAWLRRWDPRVLHRRDLSIFLASGGLIAYCAFLRVAFADQFAFATVQSAPGWDQGPGWQTWLKADFVAEVARNPLGPASLGMVFQASLALAVLAMVPWVARKIAPSYALFVALIALMPIIATKDFQGAGRYLLPAFPIIALCGHALSQRRALGVLTLAAGIPIILLFASWFAKGNYLA